jgi:glycosyltransferase involved in cell wall biosynthesis
VVSILDMQYRSHPEDLSCIARWTTHLLVQAAARRSTKLLAISEFSKREILRHTSASPDRIIVTHLAADPCFAQPAPDLFPELAHSYILCTANTYPHKNVHALAAAFVQMQSSIPHHLVLLGKARRGEASLLTALRDCDPARIHRPTWVSSDQLCSLFQHADLFVFPSLYEGFGLPVLEAMMAGTPVLTTPRGAIPEIAGDTVFYFDPDDPESLKKALSRLLHNPEERGSLAASAQARAMDFSWRKTATTTLAILCDAATGV